MAIIYEEQSESWKQAFDFLLRLQCEIKRVLDIEYNLYWLKMSEKEFWKALIDWDKLDKRAKQGTIK